MHQRTIRLAGGEVDRVTGLGRIRDRSFRLSGPQCALFDVLVDAGGATVSREELERRLGMEGGAVDAAIRRLRVKLEPDPTTPSHVMSVFGVGYRFVMAPPEPIERVGVPAARHALRGREDDLQRLLSVSRPGAVVLTGPPGVGKSALLAEAARRVEAPAVVFVDVETVGASTLMVAVAVALGISMADLSTEDQIVARAGGALRARTGTVLVLDGAETLADPVVRWVEALLREAPSTRLWVGSRVRLEVGGEHLSLDPLGADAGVALLVERAAALGATLDPATPDTIALAARLDHLPLALELAAARARTMSAASMLARLDDRLRLLSDARADDPRQASLRAALAWSWSLLGPSARRALVRLSVCVTGPDDAVVAALVGPDSSEALRELEAGSWVTRVGERWRVLESVRAWGLAEGGPEVADARRAHAACFAALGKRLRGTGVLDTVGMDALDAWLPDLLAAGAADGSAAVVLTVALHDRFHARGPFGPYLQLVAQALAVAEGAARGMVLTARASVFRRLRRRVDWLADLDEARGLVEPHQASLVAYERAMVLQDLGRFDEASEAAAEARRAALPETESMVAALGVTAEIAARQDRYAEAEELFQRAIRLAEAVAPRRACSLRVTWSVTLHRLGRLDEAESDLRVVLAECSSLRLEVLEATTRYNLATIVAERGRHDEALELVELAEAAWAAAGRTYLCTWATLFRGELALAANRAEQALPLLQEVERAARDAGDGSLLTTVAGVLVAAWSVLGRQREARAALQELLTRDPPPAMAAVAGVFVDPGAPIPALASDADGTTRFLHELLASRRRHG